MAPAREARYPTVMPLAKSGKRLGPGDGVPDGKCMGKRSV